jgi:hypothetical protein
MAETQVAENSQKHHSSDRLIITAASQRYGDALLALLGSLNLNWPKHPPVLVYDLGLDEKTKATLNKHNLWVKPVPAFCDHWNKHYTWKIWCLNDAPALNILWLDAALVVLQPIEEIFDALSTQGYFLTTNYELLDWEASESACKGCGVSPDFRLGKLTLPAGLMGFRKDGKILAVLQEALNAALVENYIAATQPSHRWEQAIISLLMYKHFNHVVIADSSVYLETRSPQQVHGQKVWVHRRRLNPEDSVHFHTHIVATGPNYVPSIPRPQRKKFRPKLFLRKSLTKIHKKIRNNSYTNKLLSPVAR